MSPENCTASNPLDWNLNGSALKVYKVNGTDNGLNSFNLAPSILHKLTCPFWSKIYF